MPVFFVNKENGESENCALSSLPVRLRMATTSCIGATWDLLEMQIRRPIQVQTGARSGPTVCALILMSSAGGSDARV